MYSYVQPLFSAHGTSKLDFVGFLDICIIIQLFVRVVPCLPKLCKTWLVCLIIAHNRHNESTFLIPFIKINQKIDIYPAGNVFRT